jgi:hypothetical protein
VIIGQSEYEQLRELRRQAALDKLEGHLSAIRTAVAEAGFAE